MPIHLATTTSPNYEALYKDWFLKSLCPEKHDIVLHVENLNMEEFTTFAFGHDSWYFAVAHKIKHLLRIMEEHLPLDEYIVSSDADIQFFRPDRIKELVAYAESNNMDYYGMQEHHGNSYNTGFMVVKNTPDMRKMFATVVDRLIYHGERPPLGDQTIINELLACTFGFVKHEFIPNHVTVWGNEDLQNKDPIFHHAVCTINISEKIEQMKLVKERYIQNHTVSF